MLKYLSRPFLVVTQTRWPKWSNLTKDAIAGEKNVYGIYQIGDKNGRILYIGQGHIHDRLASHARRGNEPVRGAVLYRKQLTRSKRAAVQREKAELEKYSKLYGRLPPSNKQNG